MGITISQPLGSDTKDSPLAVAAVAEITQFTLVQLQALQAIWCSEGYSEEDALASREANLTTDEFEESLNSVKFAASDRAIFDRLFTLLDRTGDERVLAVQFLIGASVLLRGSLSVKLQAALQFAFDAESFFGDPPVSADHINRVVEDVIGSNRSCEELVKSIEEHPIVQQYVYPPTSN